MEVKTSNHINKRLSKRCNINKKSQIRFINKAIKEGLTIDDIKENKLLYNYMKKKQVANRDYYIYNDYIVVVSPYNNTGITTLELPKHLIPIARKLSAEKRGEVYHDKGRCKSSVKRILYEQDESSYSDYLR